MPLGQLIKKENWFLSLRACNFMFGAVKWTETLIQFSVMDVFILFLITATYNNKSDAYFICYGI